MFGEVLREGFGIQNLGKKTHPLPGDWWNVFRTIFRYDPNSLVHGILFPAMGIKLSRVLTVHHEAFGADRVGFSGVKFDKLEKTDSRQSIFANDRETAREIRATFVIDLSLFRSFGRGEQGLNDDQKRFLLELALWKIQRLLSGFLRLPKWLRPQVFEISEDWRRELAYDFGSRSWFRLEGFNLQGR